jgi:hypothetical protein
MRLGNSDTYLSSLRGYRLLLGGFSVRDIPDTARPSETEATASSSTSYAASSSRPETRESQLKPD